MIKNLAISGGGSMGIGIIGIIKYLENKHIIKNIKNYIGTSIGSLICFLLILGYTTNQIYNFFYNFDFTKIIKKKINIDNLFNNWGLNSIDNYKYIIQRLIINKKFDKDITFIKLFKLTNKNLIITGVCLTEHKLYYFNKKNNPTMKIVDAIAISSCIPIIFNPIKYNNKLWIDGGIMNNYPINYFKNNMKHTIGITIIDKYILNKQFNFNLKNYILDLIKCIIFGNNSNTYHKYKNNSFVYYNSSILKLILDNKT